MKRGLQEADNQGVETYIEASAVALDLYKKHGFAELDRVSTSLHKDGQDDVIIACMLRRANSTL
jgi:hypothetical protein